MDLKLTKEYVIDSKPVELIGDIGDLSIFEGNEELFLVRGDKVLGCINLRSYQNFGGTDGVIDYAKVKK